MRLPLQEIDPKPLRTKALALAVLLPPHLPLYPLFHIHSSFTAILSFTSPTLYCPNHYLTPRHHECSWGPPVVSGCPLHPWNSSTHKQQFSPCYHHHHRHGPGVEAGVTTTGSSCPEAEESEKARHSHVGKRH